jgi:hypothetical protein
MNRKQFAMLVAVLIALGAAAWLVENRQSDESTAGGGGVVGQSLLGESFPVNDVVQITLKDDSGQATLVKKDDLWRVAERGNYAANFGDISGFLLKARDLKVVQVEDVGPSQLPRLQLAPPGQGTNSGVIVDLKDKDGKTLKLLTLGKKHMKRPGQQQAGEFGDEGVPDGRYVMIGDKSDRTLLVADPLSNLEPKPEAWLNKDFFHIERPKAVAAVFPAETNSWRVIRDTESGDWKLANATADEKLDSSKDYGVTTPFSSPSFDDVLLPSAKAADYGLDKPTVVTVETFDDFIYSVSVGTRVGDEYPVQIKVAADFPKVRTPSKDEKPDDKAAADKAWADRQKQLQDQLKQAQAFEGWTYLMPGYTVEPLLKERKDLVQEKKDEKKEDGKSVGMTGAGAGDAEGKDDAKAPAIVPPAGE